MNIPLWHVPGSRTTAFVRERFPEDRDRLIDGVTR